MMRRGLAAVAVLGELCAAGARAQTHVVKKPETVVRAVAVYEWTGEEGKATASRVVPVSVFIDGQFEDAGVYLARPVPFALGTGTVFELEKGGVAEGTLELAFARHFVNNSAGVAGASQIDDGWLAYGAFKPMTKQTLVAAKKSGPLPQVVASGGNRPHFSNTNKGDSSDTSKNDADAQKPATPVDRSGAAGAGTTVSAQDDPDRPTMKRRDTSADTTSTDSTSSDSAKDDADRPTLKKRSPSDVKATQKKKETASVTGTGTLNDDPDRPVLHRGVPTNRMDEDQLPPLRGLPKDMHQMVAVSDAKDRPEHDFQRVWESDEERTQVTAKMEAEARAKLAQYDVSPAPAAAPAAAAAAPAAKTAAASTAGKTAAARAAARRKAAAAAAAAAAPAPVALTNEVLRAYTLSYGGAATYVYTAESAGVGGATRYVSVVAQREPQGEVKVALETVTDSTHLDRTPWMRPVDAVDADASNRASLLFELRGQTARQFALYRVIGAKAEQVFATAPPE